MVIGDRLISRYKLWRGAGSVEPDLEPYRSRLAVIDRRGDALRGQSDEALKRSASVLRQQASSGHNSDELLFDTFALVREVADRVLGMRPFDVQMLAGLALSNDKLVQMQTGEGKTLAAVAPACLAGLSGDGVHVLTFNDYLARRDAAWMGPVFEFVGLTVGCVQEGLDKDERKAAYACDVTYATAKEAGFDFLRMHLARSPAEQVQRPLHLAIVDEADAILIDEARTPLVVAGEREKSDESPYRIAEVVGLLEEQVDWEIDEYGRNVYLSDEGLSKVEHALGCGDLHAEHNLLLLTEVNQALHARVLLQRDVDYIVRDQIVELVDEFTGRVVDDRRWPDGLQAALEAKEGLPIRPGGRILGSISLQHFLGQYRRICGMTATARTAADEFQSFYGLNVVPIPPNKPCVRDDQSDLIFTHSEAKQEALITEIRSAHDAGRPVLVGTVSVRESERLALRLRESGVMCQILNAKNDELEAGIIADAGCPGAVTISTNMAGRGTDIKLGGADERDRDRVVRLGGLYVIGTNRHESRRIDDQLRGRSGRQGDPGSSRFFVSFDDPLMVRFGIDALIPDGLRPAPQRSPVAVRVVGREVDRLQRIVEGQNFEIRKTLMRYSELVEKQRKVVHDKRSSVLTGEGALEFCRTRGPDRYGELVERFGWTAVDHAERLITLHCIDDMWSEHLSHVSHIREGIHLVGIGGLDPLYEFRKQAAAAFARAWESMEQRIADMFERVEISEGGLDLEASGIVGPSATWTYLVNDRVQSELQSLLFGSGSAAYSGAAAVMTWPLLLAWGLWRRIGSERR